MLMGHLGPGVWEEWKVKRRWMDMCTIWALEVPFPVPWARIRGFSWALLCLCPTGHFRVDPSDWVVVGGDGKLIY